MASEFLRNLNHIVGRSLETEFGANTIVLSRRLPENITKSRFVTCVRRKEGLFLLRSLGKLCCLGRIYRSDIPYNCSFPRTCTRKGKLA